MNWWISNRCGGARETAPLRAILGRGVVDFFRDTRAATAIEFAMVSPFIFAIILFLMSIGYMILMNQCLDYATAKAARMIRTGQTQAAGITNTADFKSKELCPLLPTLFDCSQVIVYSMRWQTNVWTWWSYPYNIYTPYFNSANSGLISAGLNTGQQFCPGLGSEYVYLQILYPVNFWLSFMSYSAAATTYNGRQYYMIQSTAVFLNEPFAGGSSC